MRSETVRRTVLTVLLLAAVHTAAWCQSAAEVRSYPDQYVEIEEGTKKLSEVMGDEKRVMTEINVEQKAIYLMMNNIKKWETSYSNYLSTVEGFAEKIADATTLYTQAMQLMVNMYELGKYAQGNPMGVLATGATSDIYMEVTVEALKAFRIVRYTIKRGGPENKLTGRERVELLWMVSDALEELNGKIRRLSSLIRYAKLTDIWENALLGLGVLDKKRIADKALERWQRRFIVNVHDVPHPVTDPLDYLEDWIGGE
jgi:hypothetical protein